MAGGPRMSNPLHDRMLDLHSAWNVVKQRKRRSGRRKRGPRIQPLVRGCFASLKLKAFNSAAALLAMHSAVLATAIPSVRPSHAGTLSRLMNIESRSLHCEVAKHSSFLLPTMVVGRCPFPPKSCTQSDPPPLKSADFDQYLLITSQP